MSCAGDGAGELHALEIEVVAEVAVVATSTVDADVPISQWLYDPTDVAREQAGLTSLLGAVEALERHALQRGLEASEAGCAPDTIGATETADRVTGTR